MKPVEAMTIDEIESELLSRQTGGKLTSPGEDLRDVEKFQIGRNLGGSQLAAGSTKPVVTKPTTPVPSLKPVEEMTEEEILAELGRDPDKKDYANGSSVEAALPISPLSQTERFTLFTLGNKQGQMAKLKEMFPEGVDLDKEGNFRVKKGNLWHQVDPDNFGDADGWQKTRGVLKAGLATAAGTLVAIPDLAEKVVNGVLAVSGSGKRFDYIPDPQKIVDFIVKDDAVAGELASEVAENVDTAASLAMPAGGAAVTAGRLIATAAATAGISKLITSNLGRLDDTYKGDYDDQLVDIGTDMLFSSLGAGISVGVKPTADWLASSGAVQKMAKSLKEMDPAAKATLLAGYDRMIGLAKSIREGSRNTLAKWQGITGSDLADVVDNTDHVVKYLGKFKGKTVNEGVVESVDEIAPRLIKEISATKDHIWNSGIKEISESLPSGFKISAKDATDDVFDWFQSKGLLQLRKGVKPEMVAKATQAGDDIAKFYEPVGIDAARTALAQSGSVKNASISDRGWSEISSLFSTVRGMRAGSSASMPGVNPAIDAISAIRTRTNDLRLLGVKETDTALRGLAQDLAGVAENGMAKKLSAVPAALDRYNKMNTDYRSFSKLTDLIDEAKNSTSPTAKQDLFQALSVKSLKGTKQSGLLEEAVAKARDLKSPVAKRLENTFTNIRGLQTAANLARVADRRNLGNTVAGSVLTTALLSTNVPLAAAIGAGAAARNPLNSVRAVRLINAANRSKGLLQAAANTRGGRALEAFKKDPQAMYALTQGWLDYDDAREQSKEVLLQQIPGANGGQQ